jgi:hypothetical protein
MARSHKNTAIDVAYSDYEAGLTSAEEELLLAILIAALQDLNESGRKGRKAREYLLSLDEEYLFSFKSICDHLMLDPENLLKRLGL